MRVNPREQISRRARSRNFQEELIALNLKSSLSIRVRKVVRTASVELVRNIPSSGSDSPAHVAAFLRLSPLAACTELAFPALRARERVQRPNQPA